MHRFENLYEKNKLKWARQDCQTARFAYRVMYSIPRVPIDQTENLTEYEFEYELILKHEYELFLEDLRSGNPIDLSNGNFGRSMRTDPEIYDYYKKKIEDGKPLDIKLPDTSNVPRLSQMKGEKIEPQKSDLVQVNPEDVFGKLFGGGK